MAEQISTARRLAQTPLNVSEIVALNDKIVEKLRTVYDPEIPVNIYDLGLDLRGEGGAHRRRLCEDDPDSPGCPAAGTLPGEVEDKIVVIPGVKKVKVDVVWEPTWDKEHDVGSRQTATGILLSIEPI